jgi:hypothetical protein
MGTVNGRLPATILDSCMSLAFTLGGRGALGETRAGAPAQPLKIARRTLQRLLSS